jgi:hypothetical protein
MLNDGIAGTGGKSLTGIMVLRGGFHESAAAKPQNTQKPLSF